MVGRGILDTHIWRGVGDVIEEEVPVMGDGHPTTDLRLTGGDMM